MIYVPFDDRSAEMAGVAEVIPALRSCGCDAGHNLAAFFIALRVGGAPFRCGPEIAGMSVTELLSQHRSLDEIRVTVLSKLPVPARPTRSSR